MALTSRSTSTPIPTSTGQRVQPGGAGAAQPASDVNQFGLAYRKSTGLPMLIIALYSPHQHYDSLFLANYANININDALYRVRGVARCVSSEPAITRCGSG